MMYGLEKEYFLTDSKGKLIAVPTDKLPFDSCGVLVEARGKPYDNIREAIFSLLAEEDRIKTIVKNLGYNLIESPFEKIDKELKYLLMRTFDKGTIKYNNLYGYLKHKTGENIINAGIHISITEPIRVKRENDYHIVNKNIDWFRFFKYLDTCFKEEINQSRRNIGFYELKNDGRIEYRSLPNTINLTKVIDVIEQYKW